MSLDTDLAIERLALGVIDRSLPKALWTHEGHFAFALWACRHRRDLLSPEAARRVISRYNAATGTPNTDTGGYHHTITLASLLVADDHLHSCAEGEPLHAALRTLMAALLGKSTWLLAHWREATLFGVEARRVWVKPDLAPLPFATCELLERAVHAPAA